MWRASASITASNCSCVISATATKVDQPKLVVPRKPLANACLALPARLAGSASAKANAPETAHSSAAAAVSKTRSSEASKRIVLGKRSATDCQSRSSGPSSAPLWQRGRRYTKPQLARSGAHADLAEDEIRFSPFRLAPVEDCLDDVGRQAGERQEPADVGVRDALLLGQVGDRLRLTALDLPTPPVRAHE